MGSEETSQKSLILLRGLPGSGKTTLAEVLCEKGKYPVFSIDSYFTHPETGEYSFDFQTNHLAYRHCEERAADALSRGAGKVFVDNTFTLEWEMKPYMEMAERYGYRVFVVTVENRHGGKNTHGISDEQIGKMAAKYRVSLSG